MLQEHGDALKAVTAAISVLEVWHATCLPDSTSPGAPGKLRLWHQHMHACARMRPSATLAWAPT